jgi:CelD/BcsL family acetyltransferase involved in cellulose biosynthesis
METNAIRTRVLEGFDDPAFGPEPWEQLLHAAGMDAVYLTWHCQRAWWETLGRGRLLLIAAEQDGRVVALAPFYTDAGMVFFVGSSFELDCLGFIGDVSLPPILEALLETARARAPGFVGFQLFFLPDGIGNRLQAAAARLGLMCFAEDEMRAPVLELAGQSAALADKKSLARYERRLRHEGQLEVQNLSDGEAILPHLEPFFAQHIVRWQGTGNPSRFVSADARAFFERLTRVAAHTGWLRFTRIDWQGRPIAFHYGFCYRGRFYWGTPAFAVDLARHSPGQVLLRQLLLAARHEGARVVDFGTGDAPFKLRFATRVRRLRTWALYPSSRARLAGDACAARLPTT